MSSSRPEPPTAPVPAVAGASSWAATGAASGAQTPSAVSGARPGRRPFTLRTKLIVGFVVTIIALSAVIGVVTEVFLSDYLLRQLDSRVVSTQVRFGPPPNGQPGGQGQGGFGAERLRVFQRQLCSNGSDGDPRGAPEQPDDSLFAVLSGNSVTTATVRGHYPTCTEPSAAQAFPLKGIPVSQSPTTVSLGDYGDFRVIATPAVGGMVIVTGLSMNDVHDTQARLAVIMAVVAGCAVLAGGVVVWLVVRRSMRPLERVAATARQVTTLPLHSGEVDLGIRVPAEDTDPRTEVGQMGAALNQMLGHVSGALSARQKSESKVRRFVADASHELRTPLASIRGYAELAGRNPDDTPAVRHALRRVRSESERMSTLVDDLLLLARIDAGRPLAHESVDLTLLAIDAVSDARAAGPDHRWLLDLPEQPLCVVGDGARLHQVVANLLANARTHNAPGSTVVTGLRAERGTVVLTVADDGEGIAESLQGEIFGRFVRGEKSRSRAAGSTGLGLAIVSAVTAAHQGTVAVSSRPGRTVFTVCIPIEPKAVTRQAQ
jgi:two-component system OmpR family sensor kinase